MSRKQYPLRIDSDIWDAIQKWAADDMRSANGQVEYLLRDALKRAGRLPELSGGSIWQETPGQEAPSCNLAVQDRVLRHFALQPIGATIRLAA